MLKTKKTHVTDMTEGNALKVIIQFALPLMAANVLQQIFSLTDAMILGIFTGDEGLGGGRHQLLAPSGSRSAP